MSDLFDCCLLLVHCAVSYFLYVHILFLLTKGFPFIQRYAAFQNLYSVR